MLSEPLLPLRDEEPGQPVISSSFDFHSVDELPKSSLELNKELVVAERRAWQQLYIVQWSRQKLVHPFVVILRRGLEPKLLALSAAMGLTLGVFPICGVPLLFCALAALVLRSNCHLPTLMLANFLASFFELGLVVPYMRVGESVTGGERFYLSSIGLWQALRGHESRVLFFGMLHAIIGWLVLAPITMAVLFVSFLPVFKYMTAKLQISKFPLHDSDGDHQADAKTDGASTASPECVINV